MTTTTRKTSSLSYDAIDALAGDLLRSLTPHAGDPDAVHAELLRWLGVLDTRDLSFVCMRAVQVTFADCLTVTPLDQAPPGALALIPPEDPA